MKTIKFNLNINNQMIRTVDELITHFNIDEIYELYKSGILQKWLRINHEHDLADELDDIENNENLKETISKILLIFGFDFSETELETHAYMYKSAYRERAFIQHDIESEYEDVIQSYHQNYNLLKSKLLQYEKFAKIDSLSNSFRRSLFFFKKNVKNNNLKEEEHSTAISELNFVKATVNEIANHSLELFKLNVVNFYHDFIADKPVVIMCCLMNPKLKEILWSKKQVRESLIRLSTDNNMLDKLKPYSKSYTGSTDGMWKYLGDVERSYLVINIGRSCRVGEQKVPDVDYDYKEIDGEYKILEGLLFKSSSTSQYINYIEV